MRKAHGLWRWVLILAATGMVFSSLDSCVADLLREVADGLNQQAYELDGDPQTIGQWWDDLWGGDPDADAAQDFDDWWDDLWD